MKSILKRNSAHGCATAALSKKKGLSVRRFDLRDEWASLGARARRRRWYHQLESNADDLPLFIDGPQHSSFAVPDSLRDIFPEGFPANAFTTLEQAGIQVGQGLRTGCNRFFYVTACDSLEDGFVRVEASSHFGNRHFAVPMDAVRPVLRRQSEVASVEDTEASEGRVLDLRGWILPEDYNAVADARSAYTANGETLPRVMPDELADYVRIAAASRLEESNGKRIPELSAVRTNVRIPRNGKTAPRFWYMLPDFAPRHLPAAFVPRIIQGLAWVESNRDPPFLIDANFSTFWTTQEGWSRHALKALLNSTWSRTFMEALGTPLGGGALKLEATHLRHMPVPILPPAAREKLDNAGRHLTRDAPHGRSRIDEIILTSVLSSHPTSLSVSALTDAMNERARNLSSARQRAA
ncbi:MAG: chemotaxis protein CheW [Pseudorhodoplanes sp.]|nr:chemotaxis protein CheW [Pseudorhodoplanes sp.]